MFILGIVLCLRCADGGPQHSHPSKQHRKSTAGLKLAMGSHGKKTFLMGTYGTVSGRTTELRLGNPPQIITFRRIVKIVVRRGLEKKRMGEILNVGNMFCFEFQLQCQCCLVLPCHYLDTFVKTIVSPIRSVMRP